MIRSRGRRTRLGVLLAMALGAVAIFALPATAGAKDRNHDHIPDRWEKRHHLSLKVNQARRDQDRDHLSNRAEFRAGDNPRDRDSDDDGIIDGEENAGTIASYDAETGKLTINLFGGDTITGVVGEGTRIRCGGGCDHGEGEGESGATVSSQGADDEGHQGVGEDHGSEGSDDPPGHDGTPPGSSEGPGRGASNSANCTTADLVEGAVVKEAELEIENGVATFSKVELGS